MGGRGGEQSSGIHGRGQNGTTGAGAGAGAGAEERTMQTLVEEMKNEAEENETHYLDSPGLLAGLTTRRDIRWLVLT